MLFIVIVLFVMGEAQSKIDDVYKKILDWWVILLFQVKQNDLTQVNSHVTNL